MNASQRIDELGGPSKVAELLKLKSEKAVQRVSNWKRRGIPVAVLVKHQDVFGPIADTFESLSKAS